MNFIEFLRILLTILSLKGGSLHSEMNLNCSRYETIPVSWISTILWISGSSTCKVLKGIFPSGNFPNVKFPKQQLASQVRPSRIARPLSHSVWPLGHSSLSARPHCSLQRLKGPILTFGKLTLGKLNIWEVGTWKVALGKISYKTLRNMFPCNVARGGLWGGKDGTAPPGKIRSTRRKTKHLLVL